MEKGSINSLLVVLMMIAVGGFAILSDNGSNSDSSSDDGENQQMEDEWDVHYVDSGDDLPNCNSDTLGRLYYVASIATFEVCLTSGWSFIDIKGADGEQGPPGEPGPAGSDGADGTNGTNGTNGINGQDGTNGQDGSASPQTMLTSVSTPTLQECSSGGRIIAQGLDNGDDGGVAQNGILESGEMDYSTTYCSTHVVSRVSKVNFSPFDLNNDELNRAAVMGNRLYFTDNYRLYVHDSVNRSTWVVGSGMGPLNALTVIGDRVYFSANDLYVHDSSDESNSIVFEGNARMIEALGTRLYFYGDNSADGYELWAHETTNGTTWQVTDINPDGNGFCAWPMAVGTRIYCLGNSGTGYALWAHETINESTWEVTDLAFDAHEGDWTIGGWSGFANIGTQLFWAGNNGTAGSVGLWTHDTANGSTWQVTENMDWYIGENLLTVDTQLYFPYDSNIYVHETINGSTWQVTDHESGSGLPSGLTLVDSRIYFTQSSGIFVYDISSDSSVEIIDFNTSVDEGGIYAIGDSIYFVGYDSDFGWGLYMSEIEHSITYN